MLDSFTASKHDQRLLNVLISLQLGKLKEAIHDCTQAVELDPDYIRAYQRRAKL